MFGVEKTYVVELQKYNPFKIPRKWLEKNKKNSGNQCRKVEESSDQTLTRGRWEKG